MYLHDHFGRGTRIMVVSSFLQALTRGCGDARRRAQRDRGLYAKPDWVPYSGFNTLTSASRVTATVQAAARRLRSTA
jgi:hypothetical protein